MHNDGRGLLTNTRIENRNTRKLMKDLILGILLVTSLAFGSLFMHERLRTKAALADNTGLRQQVTGLEAKGSQQEEKACLAKSGKISSSPPTSQTNPNSRATCPHISPKTK